MQTWHGATKQGIVTAATLDAADIGMSVQYCDLLHVQLWLDCLSQFVAGYECSRGKGDAAGFSAEA